MDARTTRTSLSAPNSSKFDDDGVHSDGESLGFGSTDYTRNHQSPHLVNDAPTDTVTERVRRSLDAFERARRLDKAKLESLSPQRAAGAVCSEWAEMSWCPALDESTQQQLEYALPVTLSVLGWLLSYSWKGHAACILIIVLHTLEVAVTDFGPSASSMRLARLLTPIAHHCIDVCLISGLALAMMLLPAEFGSFPKVNSFALMCTIPPYLLISYKTLKVRSAGKHL